MVEIEALLESDRGAALARLDGLSLDAESTVREPAIELLVKTLGRGSPAERARALELASTALQAQTTSPALAAALFEQQSTLLSSQGAWPEDDSAQLAQAEALRDRLDSPEARAGVLHSVGAARLRARRFAEAEPVLRQGLSEIEDRPASRVLALLQGNLGVALAQQGRLADAMAAFVAQDEALRAAGEPAQPNLLRNISSLNILLEDWPRAIDYAERAMALLQPDTKEAAPLLTNMASGWIGLGELQKARVALEQSLAISERFGLDDLSARNNYGYVLLQLGELQAARAQFEAVRDLASAAQDIAVEAVALKNLGDVWIRLGERRRADDHLQRALALHARHEQPHKRLELLQLVVDNLEGMGRHAEALRRMRELKALADELVNVESLNRIAELENSLQLKESEAELAVQKARLAEREADLASLKARERQELIERNALFALVVALVVIVLLLVRQVRDRARANRELSVRNSEIEAQGERLRSLNGLVKRQSEEDALTGLNNRRYLQALLPALAARQGEAARALAIVADLDHFKQINDRWGHEAGDRVLCHVANLLRQCARSGDALVRWGGEEFVWICQGADASEGPSLSARLREALMRNPIEIAGESVCVTASIGYAAIPLWPDQPGDPALTLKLADHAAYAAKRAGRNRWAGFEGREPPPLQTDLSRIEIEAMEASGWVASVRGTG